MSFVKFWIWKNQPTLLAIDPLTGLSWMTPSAILPLRPGINLSRSLSRFWMGLNTTGSDPCNCFLVVASPLPKKIVVQFRGLHFLQGVILPCPVICNTLCWKILSMLLLLTILVMHWLVCPVFTAQNWIMVADKGPLPPGWEMKWDSRRGKP